MTQKIHFTSIDASDAKGLHDLQKKLFPVELTESLKEIEAILVNADKVFNCNHSFAVYDNLEMVGYVFAYIDSKSIFHGRQEEVFYVKEFGLLPGYERYLRLMISKLTHLWLTYAPQLAAEAHAVEEAKNKWLRIPKILQQFEINLETRLGDREGGEQDEGSPDYFFLRWEAGLSERVQREYSLSHRGWQYQREIVVHVVSDERKLEALRSDWNKLLNKKSGENFLGSFDFVKAWWKYFGTWRELFVIVIRRGDDVIGIAPLMKGCWNREGLFEQELSIIGEPSFVVLPQLLFAENEELCLSAMMAYLVEKENASVWQSLVLTRQCTNNFPELISDYLSGSEYSSSEVSSDSKALQLGNDFQHFVEKQLPGKDVYNSLLGLQTSHVFESRSNIESSQEVIDVLSDMEEGVAENRVRINQSESHYFFYLVFIDLLLTEKKLRWYVLRDGSKVIASSLGFAENNIFYLLMQNHRDDYPTDIKDSLLLSATKDLIAEGVTKLIFSDQTSDQKKSIFTIDSDPLSTVFVGLKKTLMGRIISRMKRSFLG